MIRSSPIDAKAAVLALSCADPALGRLMRRHGPFTLEVRRGATPFERLGQAIVRQQLSNRVADVIAARLKVALGGAWQPEAVREAPDDLLRGAGLSRAKAVALKDLAAKTLDGTVPGFAALDDMADEEIILHLTEVKGIGEWTAQMFLIFALGRPDVMPIQDLGVRRGFQRVHGLAELPLPPAILDHSERWRPWRTVASWYLWRAAEAE
ncbi:MAG: DNA-3-methyladenine glycosylase family protein [Stellaceae bacterium]